MTVGSYAGVARRVIREFPDDPVLVHHVLNADGLAPILTALAESFAAAAEANVVARTGARDAGDVATTVERAVERRETALLDIMQFFDLQEVCGRDIVVRRASEAGLSVRRRTDVPLTADA